MSCASPEPRRIALLVRRLDCGGAQRQLVLLAGGLRQAGHEVHVVTFYPDGMYEGELARQGVRVHSLDKRGRWDALGFGWRMATCLRRVRPHVLYAFMDVANIAASLVRPWLPGHTLAWGLRASDMERAARGRFARWVDRLERRLSASPDLVIANSGAGRDDALARGFPPDRTVHIPNGIDTTYFQPDRPCGARLRAAWGVLPQQRLVGLVGRLDPMKGHADFIDAAARLAAAREDLRFVCVGSGPPDRAAWLAQHAARLGLGDRLRWVATREDMPCVYGALDISVSASVYGEGFSNTIAESMACGVPCVVTEVGDSARIVGDLGRVVPPGRPAALAAAIGDLADLPPPERLALGRACRGRVVSLFGTGRMVRLTAQALGLA